MIRNILLLLITVLLFSCNPSPRSIQFGDQVWMNENLSASRFRNGDEIPEAKTRQEWVQMCNSGKPAWCNPVNNKGKNAYGKLYNWAAVSDPRGLAPKGWHVPTDDEWSELTTFLGGEVHAAYILRTTGEDNESPAFAGLPAGACKADGMYIDYGSKAYWWSSTSANEEFAWIRRLNYIEGNISSITWDKKDGLSVRCIKDK